MNKSLSPDERADMVLKQMTLDEKISLLHGNGMAREPQWEMPLTHLSNGGAGYVVGVKRLGIPPIYHVGRRLWRAQQRGERTIFDRAYVQCRLGRKLGPASRLRVRRT